MLKELKPLEKGLLTFMFFFTLLGLFLGLTNKKYYESVYAMEDGFLEWTTVYVLLCCAYVCLDRFLKLKSLKPKLFLSTTLFAIFIFLFGAGEEISWGQRILDVPSPVFFAQNNSQQETNFHNLVVEGKRINKIIFGTGLGIVIATYLLILPFLYQRKNWVKETVDRLGIPVAKKHHVLSYALLFLLVSLIPTSKRGEVLEFGGCILFLLMLKFPLNQSVFEK